MKSDDQRAQRQLEAESKRGPIAKRIQSDPAFAAIRLDAIKASFAVARRASNIRLAGLPKVASKAKPVAMAPQISTAANQIEVFGEIDDASAIEFKRRLERCDKEAPITIRIDSQGGSVMAGNSIVDAINAWPGTTTAIVESNALSMASAILAACDVRLVSPNAMVMIHPPFTEEAAVGSDIDLIVKLKSNLIKTYAGVVKGGSLKVVEMMAKGDSWMSGSEAIKCGLATGWA